MKRRELMRYAGAGLLAAVGTGFASGFETYQAQTGGSLSVQWLGHTSFLFTGSGKRILVNPFKPIGCTAKYRSPKVAADLVLVSSLLFDEGSIEGLPGNPKILYEPGAYEFDGINFQGISINHDRLDGRQFGNNVAWRWNQGGIRVLHLGGAAAPIATEQQILMGRPDLALIPVGGGVKAYTAEEAKQAIQVLNPKVVIPTHYRTQAADAASCDIAGLDGFLELMAGNPVHRINGDKLALKSADLPQNGSVIEVLSYKF
jgi:L-ascorbate metabolism protein UlaG (beta-lactamase superfamily)